MKRGDLAAPRRLVVNGDDFGLATSVNEGIFEAYERGILTSASLMVGGDAASEAVGIARAAAGLGVGLHLTLIQGRSSLPAERILGLVGADRRFRENPVLAGIAYFFSPRLRQAIVSEVRAQLEAFRATGLVLSHVDGHLNVHLHPFVQEILVELAEEFAIPAIRLTRDPLLRNLRFDRRHVWRKSAERVIFATLSGLARRRFERRPRGRPIFVDSVFGMHQTGMCDEPYLRHVLQTLPVGTHELYCHPATHQTREMRRVMPGYRPDRELAALISPEIDGLVARAGIALVSFPDLAPSPGRVVPKEVDRSASPDRA